MQPARAGRWAGARRDATAALLAALVHGLLLWATRRSPPPLLSRRLAQPAVVAEVELSIVGETREVARPGAPASPPGARARSAFARRAARASTPTPSEPTAPAPALPSDPVDSNEYGAGDPLLDPAPASVPRGVGGVARDVALGSRPSAAPAPTRSAPAPAPDRDVAGAVLSGTLRARDAKLGGRDPWAGKVANDVGEAVRAASLPTKTRATIAIRFDARGELAGVELERCSGGDASTWAAVTRAVAAGVAAHPLPAASAAGARVVVTVQSLRLLPAESSGLLAPGVRWFDPPELNTAGGRFDLSNIGAHEQTVVRWSIAVLRPGDRAQPAGAVLPYDDAERWVPARPGRAERPGKPCPAEGRGCPEPVLRPLRSVRSVLDMRPGDE